MANLKVYKLTELIFNGLDPSDRDPGGIYYVRKPGNVTSVYLVDSSTKDWIPANGNVSDKEDIANKKQNLSSPNSTDYPSTQAVKTALDLKANDSDVVKLTGSQVVGGDKIFTNPLKLPITPLANEDAASKKYVDDNKFNLPSQSGNSGKYLYTDGTTPSWQTPSGGGGGSMNTFTAGGNIGLDQTISDGNHLKLEGKSGIITEGKNTDIVEIRLSTDTITSLGKADTAVQPAGIAGKEDISNKKTDLVFPNNTTYPTTKAVKDYIGTGVVTINRNGSPAGTLNVNQTNNSSINIVVPTKVTDLTDSGDYAKLTDLPPSIVTEDTLGDFPGTGVANTIYIALDTGKQYVWNGASYVEIGGPGLMLGETNSTAYRGDRGKTAYDHTSLTNNPHNVTFAQLPDAPTIPTVNDKTLTIQKNGVTIDTFTGNSTVDKTINIIVPTDTGDLSNSAGFLTTHQDISGKEDVSRKKTTLADNSDIFYPTQKAVKTAVDAKADASTVTSHTSNMSNPHGVTKAQVGLGNVDNTSDMNKPVSTAVSSALSGKEDTSNKVITFSTPTNTEYPSAKLVKDQLDLKQDVLISGTHIKTVNSSSLVGSGNITIDKTVIGLPNVTNDAQLKASQLDTNIALGVDDTKVPSQKAVKNYVDGAVTGKQDALGFTPENNANKKTTLTDNSDTFYPTQKAVKTAVDAKADSSTVTSHISNTSNPHNVTKTQVGLANVTNDAQLKASQLDTNISLGSDDTKVPSQKAVKTYVDSAISGSSPKYCYVNNHSSVALNSGDGEKIPLLSGGFPISSGITYNSFTKEFTVPSTGIYEISYTIVSAPSNSSGSPAYKGPIHYDIQINGSTNATGRASQWSDSNKPLSTISNSILVSLSASDKINLYVSKDSGSTVTEVTTSNISCTVRLIS